MILSMNLPRPKRDSKPQPEELPPILVEDPFAPPVMEVLPAEPEVAPVIENRPAKSPSDAFLWAGLGTLGVSLVLRAAGKKHASLLVSQWSGPLLLLSVYNKIAKASASEDVIAQV